MDINRRPAGAPTTRLVWMLGLTVFLGAAIFYLFSITASQRRDTLTQAEKAPREEDDFANPLYPEEPIKLADTLAATIDESTPLARSTIEPEPYRDLLSKLINRTQRFMREVIGYEKADHDALLADPAKHRAKPVWVRGTLVDYSQRLLERPIGEHKIAYFGVIEDFDGKRFWYETLFEPDAYEIGEITVARGLFMKDFAYIKRPGTPMELKNLPDRVDHLPLLVCRRVESSYRIEPVTALDKKLVRTALWGMRTTELQLDLRPLYHLLGYMKNADASTFPTDAPNYEDMAERLLVNSRLDKYRGEFVKIWGRLGPIYKHEDPENPAGITHHYRAYVFTPGRVLLPVFLAEKPKGFKPYEDYVDVTGIFFKPWRYITEEGKTIRAPVVVAKSLTLRKIDPGPWEHIMIVLVVGVFVAIIAVGLLIYRDRRDLKRHNEEFIRRRRERRLRAEAE